MKELLEYDFEQSMPDPLCFRLLDEHFVGILIVIHVNDMLVTCVEENCERLTEALQLKFPTKNLGELTWYSGYALKHNTESGTLETAQTAYTEHTFKEILEFTNVAPTPSYMSTSDKVDKVDDTRGNWPYTTSGGIPDVAGE